MDPAFDNGLDRDSVVDMVNDIGRAFLDNTDFIISPKPITGIGPATHIKFKDDSDLVPSDLNVQQKGQPSRRSQSYYAHNQSNISRNTSHSTHRGSNMVTLDIDDAINMIGGDPSNNNLSDEEYQIDEDDDKPSNINVQKESTGKSIVNEIVGRPAGRRIIRRGGM